MSPKNASNRFSKKTLEFLVKAGRQKNPHWLEKNQEEYEAVVRGPFIHLAERVKAALWRSAPGYHFPSKGLARIKRPDFKVARGQNQYKDWISMMATRPSPNRFESNPRFSEDHEDIDWIQLKKFVVYKKVTLRDFSSARFTDTVIRDFRQALRLNELLDLALSGKWPPP